MESGRQTPPEIDAALSADFHENRRTVSPRLAPSPRVTSRRPIGLFFFKPCTRESVPGINASARLISPPPLNRWKSAERGTRRQVPECQFIVRKVAPALPAPRAARLKEQPDPPVNGETSFDANLITPWKMNVPDNFASGASSAARIVTD